MQKGCTEESPPAKRCKLAENTNFQIKAILPNEYTENSLEIVFASKIEQKQQISRLMQELSQHFPLPEALQHLKRVRQSDLIVCRKKDVSEGLTLKEFLNTFPLSIETVEALCKNVIEVEVSASACKLRWQYELMRTHWPCKFHPDKYLESMFEGTYFKKDELDFHQHIFDMLQQLSQQLELQRPCGICVDPRTNSIVAMAASRTEINPLYHCCMVLIDFVARTQNPCILNEQYDEKFVTSSKQETKECILTGIPQKYKNFMQRNDNFTTIKMGAEPIKFKQKLTAEHVFEQAVDNLTKYGPYLCTGYDIYLTNEPCLMCAMALVHSRVRRVFFNRQSTGNGALLTHFKLHAVKELNHHYEVFQCYGS